MKEWDADITKRRIRRLKRFLHEEALDLGPHCGGLNGYAVVSHYKDVTRTLKKLVKYAALPALLLVGCHVNMMPNQTRNYYEQPATASDLPPLPDAGPPMPAGLVSWAASTNNPVFIPGTNWMRLETNNLAWECVRCNETGIEGSNDLRAWTTEAVLPSWVYVPPASPSVGGGFVQRTNFTVTIITTNEPVRFWRAFSR